MRPRWVRISGKSVRCCVQAMFIILMISPIDGYREFFMGTVQMVVAIPLCFGRLAFPYFLVPSGNLT